MEQCLIIDPLLALMTKDLSAQSVVTTTSSWRPVPRKYAVKHAVEVERPVPMFFTGGYQFALGYRYRKFRVRASIIHGGAPHLDPGPMFSHDPTLRP